MLRRIAFAASVLALAVPARSGRAAAASAQPPPELVAACRNAVPDEMLAGAEPGATRGSGEVGEWRIETDDLDGNGTPEAFLVVLPADRGGEVRFFALRDGRVTDKRIGLGGAPLTSVSLGFDSFVEGRDLAHVNAGDAGQVLLDWDGKKLDTVWKSGKPRGGERRWYVLEDLDQDGASEVVVYVQRELDVSYADEEGLESTPGASAPQVDAVAVYRWSDGRWRKDDRLLDERR